MKKSKPINHLITEIFDEIPEEEWKKIPRDGAMNIKHYLYGASKVKECSGMPENIYRVRFAAKAYDLDETIICALIYIESSYNPWIYRYEPQYKWIYKGRTPGDIARRLGITERSELMGQKTSWGLMQIMGATARDMGFTELHTQLLQPETNLEYGCKFLASLRKRYPEGLDYIAAYNAGSPRRDNTGYYVNQPYIDTIMEKVEELISDKNSNQIPLRS